MLFFLKITRLLRNDVDIWFAEESGFVSDPRARKRWDYKFKADIIPFSTGHPAKILI